MTDYHIQASFTIPLCNKEETKWWEETLEQAWQACREGDFTKFPPDVQAAAEEFELDHDRLEFFGDWHLCNEDGNWLWAGSDHLFDHELWAVFIQAFLRRFHPERTFGFECSRSCDELEDDAFGGFAVFITKEKLHTRAPAPGYKT